MRPNDAVRGACATAAFAVLVFASVTGLLVVLLAIPSEHRPLEDTTSSPSSPSSSPLSPPPPPPPPPADVAVPGVSAFVVPAAFPTTAYASYYVEPGPTNEPQPVVYDPVLNTTFPLELTSPFSIPQQNDVDPPVFPAPRANLSDEAAAAVVRAATEEILSMMAGDGSDASDASDASPCARCVAALAVGQMAARLAPTAVPEAMVTLCMATGFASNASCRATYAAAALGAPWTQVLAAADVAGLDGQYICAALGPRLCPRPALRPVRAVFPKPRPADADVRVPARSGRRVKVLHVSDLHLDPRYLVGSEANCTSGLCCRPPAAPFVASSSPLSSASSSASSSPPSLHPDISVPAPLFGAYLCDSPYYLALAAMQAIGPLTGTTPDDPLAFTLYTGDLVAHDPVSQMSHDYVAYVETALWQLFHQYTGGPVYCALGNHDTAPQNLDAPHGVLGGGGGDSDDDPLGRQFSWNYEHVSRLWQHYGWLDNATAAAAAALHYGAYSVVDAHGVRIITLNTDLYLRSNAYALLRAADPDAAGIFAFLIAELQTAEDAGQRAYIVGHVPTGWDGAAAMPGAADLFYQIVDRYSPHVVANVFFGHTHEDQAFAYYRDNATRQTADAAVAVAWVAPSLTPLHNLNAGFRLYEVDTGSWEVMDAYTFYADVDTFAAIDRAYRDADPDADAAPPAGPVFRFEYSTRAAYAAAIAWPDDAPLNATFWHRLSEAVERDASHTLADRFNTYQGKSSARTPNCTSAACATAKACYMRSGSVALGQACPQGFSSVQSPFTGDNW